MPPPEVITDSAWAAMSAMLEAIERNGSITLLVDLDNVLNYWYAGVVAGFRRDYPHLETLKYSEVTTFSLYDCYPKAVHKEIHDVANAPGFFLNLKPNLAGVGALKEIESNYSSLINARIVTAPPWTPTEGELAWTEKAHWVKDHLGDSWLHKLVITHDKTLVHGDFLIDDKPEVTGSMFPSWTHLRYPAPYNAATKGMTFVWSVWPTMAKELDAILARRARVKNT